MLYSPRVNIQTIRGIVMKHFILIGVILLLLIGLFILPHSHQKGTKRDVANPVANYAEQQIEQEHAKLAGSNQTTTLRNKLDSIMIEHLEFEDSPLPDIISELRKEAKKKDPAGQGVNIVLLLNPVKKNRKKEDSPDKDFLVNEKDTRSDKPAESSKKNSPPSSRDETFIGSMFDDISLGEAIRNICLAYDMQYSIDKNAVVIADKNIPLSSLKTKIFPVHDDAEFISRDKKNKNDLIDLNELFKKRGVLFTDGTKVIYDELMNYIIATATSEQMKSIKQIIEKENTINPEVVITARFIKIPECEYRKLKGNSEKDALSLPERVVCSNKSQIISSATVISNNGEKATLIVGRELYYPDSWTEAVLQRGEAEPSATPENTQDSKDGDSESNKSTEKYYSTNISHLDSGIINTSAFPEFSDPVNLGVSISATPTVAPDQYHLTLAISPKIQYFSGWNFYGKQIKIPKLSTWETSSEYKLNDGETITAGSFLEDIIDKSNGKHTKNRFLLLLTATLIHTNGVPLREQYASLNSAERKNEAASLTKKRSKLELKLDRIIIDQVNYKNADIATVVKDLSKKVSKKDKTINFILELCEESDSYIPHINLVLNNIPLNDLLRYIALQTKLKYSYKGNNILLGDESLCPMDIVSIKVRDELIGRISPILLTEEKTPSFCVMGDDNYHDAPIIKKYFSARGISFPEGSNLKYSKSEGKLLVKNTKDNLEKLKALLDWPSDYPQITTEGTMVEIETNDLIQLIGRNAALSDNLTEAQIEKIINSPRSRILESHILSTQNGEEGVIKNGEESALPESWFPGEIVTKNGYLQVTRPVPEYGYDTLTDSFLIVTSTLAEDHRTITLDITSQYKKQIAWSAYNTYININHHREETIVKMPEFKKFEFMSNLKISDGAILMAAKSQLIDLSGDNNKLNSSFTEHLEEAEKQHRKSKTIFYFVQAKIIKEK